MAGFEGAGRILIIAGAVILALGLVLVFGPRIPFLGRLPGDIIIRRDGITFYFPIITFLVLSAILTLIVNLIFRIINK